MISNQKQTQSLRESIIGLHGGWLLADGIEGRFSIALRPPVLNGLDVIQSITHQQ